jgi:hypothetical protein
VRRYTVPTALASCTTASLRLSKRWRDSENVKPSRRPSIPSSDAWIVFIWARTAFWTSTHRQGLQLARQVLTRRDVVYNRSYPAGPLIV